MLVLGPQFRDVAAEIMPILAYFWLANGITQNYLHISFDIAQKPMLYIY